MPLKDNGVASGTLVISTYRTSTEVQVNEHTTGEDLVNVICNKLNLPEPCFFGVRLQREIGSYWIEKGDTLKGICGKKWKDLRAGEFKVRFFPPDIIRITDDNILNYYYLHIRDEFLKGAILTDPGLSMLLSAHILQVESGNYLEGGHDVDFVRRADCLPKRFAKSSDAIINNIIREYEGLAGMRPLEAQIEFVDKVQRLADCGVEYYPTKDKSGTLFNIGAGHDGIFIRHSAMDKLLCFKWIDIISMRHDQKFLWLELNERKPSTFELPSREVSRLVWTAFVEQHNFKLGKRVAVIKTYGERRPTFNKTTDSGVAVRHSQSLSSHHSTPPPSQRSLLTANGSPSKIDVRNLLLQKLSNPDDIRAEYLSIAKTKPNATFKIANEPENKPTNRFRDIVPYDDTRVKLKSGSSDYINASHVSIKNAPNDYILAQGPKENTTGDFWGMVWEQGVTVIAMVTQLREGYKPKCHQYWPESEGDSKVWGDMKVTLQFCREESLYITRGFMIQHLPSSDQPGSIRSVIHLQFVSWPDHGVPSNPSDLLEYLDEIQGLVRNVTAPIEGAVPLLIHCSAGVGRSGVLLMMDVLTHSINSNQHFDITSTLRQIRNCRSHTVQTDEQYLFIHTALLEYLDQARLI